MHPDVSAGFRLILQSSQKIFTYATIPTSNHSLAACRLINSRKVKGINLSKILNEPLLAVFHVMFESKLIFSILWIRGWPGCGYQELKQPLEEHADECGALWNYWKWILCVPPLVEIITIAAPHKQVKSLVFEGSIHVTVVKSERSCKTSVFHLWNHACHDA